MSCVELGTLSQESLSFYHKKCKAISSTTQVPFLNPQEVLSPPRWTNLLCFKNSISTISIFLIKLNPMFFRSLKILILMTNYSFLQAQHHIVYYFICIKPKSFVWKIRGSALRPLREAECQPTFTCSKLTIETLGQRCDIYSELTIKTPKRRHWRH